MKRHMRYLALFTSLWVSCTFIVTLTVSPDLFVGCRFQQIGDARAHVSRYTNGRLTTDLQHIPSTTESINDYNITAMNDMAHEEKNRVLSRFDLEKQYFTPRKNKINPTNSKFLIVNRQFCEVIPYLLVLVPSVHRNAEVRHAIRTTYGSQSLWKLDNQRVNITVKLLFIFGKSSDTLDKDVLQESRKYGDIIQADFIDSYSNLTRKIMYGLKWVSTYCSEVEYVVKTDEDVFLNIPKLIEYLIRTPYGMNGAVYGFMNSGSTVKRIGKWKVTKEQYPLKTYPTYASGNSYVISGNIISRLFLVSEYMPYMPIEDAFVTGCLAKIIGADHMHNDGFTQWLSKAPDPCRFVHEGKISATRVTMSLFLKLWQALQSYQSICKE